MIMQGLWCLIFLCFYASSYAQQVPASVDWVRVPAGKRYSEAAPATKFFIGKNYREDWALPVAMPVFQLKGSGLSIEKLGGGMQTKSLQLEDRSGSEWALRTVDKDAKGALPPKSQNNKLAVSVVQDMISASYPFGALIVPLLAQAINVPTSYPKLYFVPVINDLGKYDTVLGGKVCMLELREPVPGKQKTISTKELLKKIQDDAHNQVDQKGVLRARLLDMLIADWDRHEDQYKWYPVKEGGQTIYHILPKDRDQAFFKSNGWLIRVATLFIMKWVKGFNEDLNNVKNLNYKAQIFDDRFLGSLTRSDWEEISRQVQQQWTDSIIDKAVHQLPKEAYALRGAEIQKKLMGRRDDLVKSALKYYDDVTTIATIYGTENADRFEIKDSNGGLMVRIFEKGQAKPFFEREYVRGETKLIEVYGLAGNDDFSVMANNPIKIRIWGGDGTNSYELKGKRKKIVYDGGNYKVLSAEKTRFKAPK